jgi:hypothetical protein
LRLLSEPNFTSFHFYVASATIAVRGNIPVNYARLEVPVVRKRVNHPNAVTVCFDFLEWGIQENCDVARGEMCEFGIVATS